MDCETNTQAKPTIYNFEPHYRRDGLSLFRLLFKSEGVPIDLSSCKAFMELKEPKYGEAGKAVWEFTTEAVEPNKLLTLTADGFCIFPAINSWDLEAQTYLYDLRIVDKNGFVRSFIKGLWPVNQDISKLTDV